MKHWTEPNGIFLIQIPIDWQYLNSGLSDYEEKSPTGFNLMKTHRLLSDKLLSAERACS